MKLSKRLKEYREMLDLPSANDLKTLLYDAEMLARRVEGAVLVEWSRESGAAAAHLRGRRVRILEDGL